MAEELKELSGPYEIMDMDDGETKELRITHWVTGNVTIRPAHLPEGKIIRALRVFVPSATKPTGPAYWDITSKLLVAQMLPYLERPPFTDKIFTITKHGVAPKARFTLEVRPS